MNDVLCKHEMSASSRRYRCGQMRASDEDRTSSVVCGHGDQGGRRRCLSKSLPLPAYTNVQLDIHMRKREYLEEIHSKGSLKAKYCNIGLSPQIQATAFSWSSS